MVGVNINLNKGNVSGGGATNNISKQVKGVKGVLGSIVKGAGVFAALRSITFIADFVKIIVNFAGLLFLLIGKFVKWIFTNLPTWFGKLIDWIKSLWSIFKEKIGQLWQIIKDKISELKERLVEWLKSLPDKIKEKLSEIWNTLITKIIEFKDMLISKVIELKDRIVEKVVMVVDWIKSLGERIGEFISNLKESLLERLLSLKEKISEIITNLKEKLSEKFELIKEKLKIIVDNIKEKLSSVIDYLKELPQKIWDKMKALGSIIANSIRGVISSLNPFKRKETSTDAIVTKDRVIKTDPNDTIIATKGGMGTGSNKTFNFYGVTPKEMLDVIKRELANDRNISSRF